MAAEGQAGEGGSTRLAGRLSGDRNWDGPIPPVQPSPRRDRQHRVLIPGGPPIRQGARKRAMSLRARKTRWSQEIMIPRSVHEGQEVNTRKADEVFADHASSGCLPSGLCGPTGIVTSLRGQLDR